MNLKASVHPRARHLTKRKEYQTLMGLLAEDMASHRQGGFREASFRLVEEYRPLIQSRLDELEAELTLVLFTAVHGHWYAAGDCFIEAVTKLIEQYGISLARGGDLL